MKITAALLAILLLAGCASPYALSGQQRSLVKGMSQERAQAILQSIVQETTEHAGLCATNANWIRSQPRVIGFDATRVRFIDDTAYVKSVKSRVSNFGATAAVDVNMTYGFDASAFYFDFRDARKVRVLADWVLIAGGPCRRTSTNRALGIHDTKGVFINLDVPKEKFNDVLAAIIALAPDATLLDGSGL